MSYRLICIGDSHSCFFGGEGIIYPEYPHIQKSLLKNVFCVRLGPVLAYSLNKYGTKSSGREKLDELISSLNPSKDIVMLAFGEIDCRAHVIRQAESRSLPLRIVIQEIVDTYINVIRAIIDKKFRVLVWNAVYSANDQEDNNDLEFPYYGNVVQRNEATSCFNQMMKEAALQTGYLFVESPVLLMDMSSGRTNKSYYADGVHLNAVLFKPVMAVVNEKLNGILFSQNDVFLYDAALLRRRISDWIYTRKLKAISFLRKLKLKLLS